MAIRRAKVEDAEVILGLLEQLGYPNTKASLSGKIEALLNDPDEELLVYKNAGRVVAVASFHFIPQLAVEGAFARISYLVVDKDYRNAGIGRKLEEHCEKLARNRNCDRIELHCDSRRNDAHAFYARQGYMESPKYLIKKIADP